LTMQRWSRGFTHSLSSSGGLRGTLPTLQTWMLGSVGWVTGGIPHLLGSRQDGAVPVTHLCMEDDASQDTLLPPTSTSARCRSLMNHLRRGILSHSCPFIFCFSFLFCFKNVYVTMFYRFYVTFGKCEKIFVSFF